MKAELAGLVEVLQRAIGNQLSDRAAFKLKDRLPELWLPKAWQGMSTANRWLLKPRTWEQSPMQMTPL
jgi:hypothetical protein